MNTKNRRWLLRKEPILNTIIVFFMFAYLGVFNSYNRIIAFGILIVFIILLCFSKKHTLQINRLAVIEDILLLDIFLSALFRNGQTGWKYCSLLLLCIIIKYLNLNEESYIKVLIWIERIALVFAVFTIIGFFYPYLIQRLFGFMLNENQVNALHRYATYNHGSAGLAGELSYNAFCLSLGLISVLAKIASERRITAQSILKLILLCAGICLTTKRGQFLIMIVLLLLGLIIFYLKIGRKISIRKLIIGIVLLSILFSTPAIYNFIKFNILYEGGTTLQLSGRYYFWNIAINMFKEHPILGNGINSFDIIYNYSKGISSANFAGAHNSYLQYLGEVGIVGLSLLIIVMISNLICTIKYVSQDICLYLTVFSLLGQIMVILYCFSGNPLYQPQEIFTYFYFLSINQLMLRMYGRKKYENSPVRNCGTV